MVNYFLTGREVQKNMRMFGHYKNNLFFQVLMVVLLALMPL